MTVYEIYKNAIQLGRYNAVDMEAKIESMYASDRITAEERVELLRMCDEGADDRYQIDVVAMLADLEQRVSALESKGVKVWVSGMITAKGQTVLFDVDKDGTLDYCRYDGGRPTTASKPGNIEGWVKTDSNGNVTHRITKVDGEIILVPVSDGEV